VFQTFPRAATALACVFAIVAPGLAIAETKVIEGTEFVVRLEDTISSSHAHEGDRFTISLQDDVKLSDGTTLRAGYRGVGEVLEARDNGMLGKTGKLSVRLNYLRVGDQRIKLRAQRDTQGGHNTGAQVGTLLLLWPVMPFIKGKDTSIKKGSTITAFADEDIVIASPLPPPPPEA
jgi:hypothetical protein